MFSEYFLIALSLLALKITQVPLGALFSLLCPGLLPTSLAVLS